MAAVTIPAEDVALMPSSATVTVQSVSPEHVKRTPSTFLVMPASIAYSPAVTVCPCRSTAFAGAGVSVGVGVGVGVGAAVDVDAAGRVLLPPPQPAIRKAVAATAHSPYILKFLISVS
jgi:hypothetical protein